MSPYVEVALLAVGIAFMFCLLLGAILADQAHYRHKHHRMNREP